MSNYPKSCTYQEAFDCSRAGTVEVCDGWTNDEDAQTQAEIEADLAPMTREECARRGLRHSSEDDTSEVVINGGDYGESFARNEIYFSAKGLATR